MNRACGKATTKHRNPPIGSYITGVAVVAQNNKIDKLCQVLDCENLAKNKGLHMTHIPYQTIPRDSCDVRLNKYRRKICYFLEKMDEAKAKGNNFKYWFYADKIKMTKQKIEEVRRLKEMGWNNYFEQADTRKKYYGY